MPRLTKILRITILLGGLWQTCAWSDSILLNNVSMWSQQQDSEKLTVNILVVDNVLELISEDPVPFEQADLVYNARGGSVLGQLTPGQPANFLILSQDPKDNIRVLLDTRRHARFAIHDGEIIRNYLRLQGSEQSPKVRQGWFAYSPPPIAVATNYQDSTRWNKREGRWVSGLFAGALILDRQYWLHQDSTSRQQVGGLEDDYDGGEIRGFRVGGVGTLNFDTPWVWTAFIASHSFDKGYDADDDDSFSFYDLRLDIPLAEKLSLSVGKQKEPISMERIMTLVDLPIQERAAISDALLPSRNVGAVLSGNAFDNRISLAAGVFNNWLDKDQPSSFSDNATQYVGRATWVAWQSEQQTELLHLGASLRYAAGDEGFATAVGPELNNAPDFVGAVIDDGDELNGYQFEASFRTGPYWLHGEFLRSDIDTDGSGLLQDTSFSGYHLTASWVVTGEMRPYNNRAGIFSGVPISRTVQQNGWGAIELSSRFSSIDFSDQAVSGGDMDIWSAAANWWLTPYTSVGINYRYITLQQREDGNSQGINARLTLLLE